MYAQTSSSSTTPVVAQQNTSATTTPILEQIQDLCRTISTIQQPQSNPCDGYLLDSLRRKHGIYPLDAPTCQTNQQHWTAYTLRQVLTPRAGVGFGRRLMQHDKFKLAVDLASSVLQLYKTPWLNDNWGKDDVYLVRRPGSSLNTVYQHLFIYRKFSSFTAQPDSINQPPARSIIRNQTLFTLGILLIELLYGSSINELQTAQDLNCQGTPGVVWCTAERLIEEEITLEAGQPYSDAVRRCIRCDFNRKTSSLDDQDFQQAVFDGVVAPLEKTLQRFNGQD
jgi:hypothetical protein